MVLNFLNLTVVALFLGLSPVAQAQSGLAKPPPRLLEEEYRPSCEDVFKSLCQEIGQQKGNAVLDVGTIQFGPSIAGALSASERVDLLALAESSSRLPPDIQKELNTPLSQLSKLLRVESPSFLWHHKLDVSHAMIEQALKDVAESRFESALPGLERAYGRKLAPTDLKVEQRKYLGLVYKDVTRAKYAEHPNWKRVEKGFASAKEQVLSIIEQEPFSPETKQWMRERVGSIQLRLPPEIGVQSEDGKVRECSKNEINAYYDTAENVFTVCAGLFNSVQVEDGLEFTIAHEITHALNIKHLCDDTFRTTDLGAQIEALLNDSGEFQCPQWSKLKTEIQQKKGADVDQRRVDGIASLAPWTECLLKNFSPSSKGHINFPMSASKEDFQERAKKELEQLKIEKIFDPVNYPELYLQPMQLLRSSYPEFMMAKSPSRLHEETSGQILRQQRTVRFVTKELQCRLKNGASATSDADRKRLLKEATRTAIQTDVDLQTAMRFKLPGLCFRATGEAESDWWGAFSTFKKIAKRDLPLKERRELMIANIGRICVSPSIARDSRDGVHVSDFEQLLMAGGDWGKIQFECANSKPDLLTNCSVPSFSKYNPQTRPGIK